MTDDMRRAFESLVRKQLESDLMAMRNFNRWLADDDAPTIKKIVSRVERAQ